MANITEDIGRISASNFAFSAGLYEQLQVQQPGHLVFSPFSLALALVMARLGARGQTAEEMDRTVGFPSDLNSIMTGYRAALKSFTEPSEHHNVTIATRIYAQEGFGIQQNYTDAVMMTVGTEIGQLNFSDEATAAEEINKWVLDNTNGKIQDLISSDSLSSETKLVLISAIYFKSPWEHPFPKNGTSKVAFKVQPSETVDVDMMVQTDSMSFGTFPALHNATVVVLPYKGRRFSMYLYVPRQEDGLEKLRNGLKATSIDAIKKNLTRGSFCFPVKLSLPRFKIASKLNLVEPLEQMGAVMMFNQSSADFRGIPEDQTTKNLHVSQVIQKAFIEVNEEGTEAAAATALQIQPMCAPTITEVTVDRPFYYQIIEESTNLVLFAGAVVDPTQ